MKKKMAFLTMLMFGLVMTDYHAFAQVFEPAQKSFDGSQVDLWVTPLKKNFGKKENLLEITNYNYQTYTEAEPYCYNAAIASQMVSLSADRVAAVPALVDVMKINDGFQFIITTKMEKQYEDRAQSFYVLSKNLDLSKLPKGAKITAFMNDDYEWEPCVYIRKDAKDPYAGGVYKSLRKGSKASWDFPASDAAILKKLKFSFEVTP